MNDIIEAKKRFSEFNFPFFCIVFIQLEIISPLLLQNVSFKAFFKNFADNVLVNSRTWNQNQKFPEDRDSLICFLNGKLWISCSWKQMTGTWILNPGFRGLVTLSTQIFFSFLCHQFIMNSSTSAPSPPFSLFGGPRNKKPEAVLS